MSAISITVKSHSAKWRVSGFVLLAILGVEVYYLIHDIAPPRTKAENSLIPIAELITSKNQVRVQDPDHLVWNDTHDKQTLYRRQTLLTLDRSSAEVAFLDGTGLTVGENSMIQLEKNPSDDSQGFQKIVVTLLRGTLTKSAPRKSLGISPSFEIKFGNTTATIPPTSELAISVDPELSNHQLLVHSGEITLQKPEEQLIVTEGEEVQVAAEDIPGKKSLIARKSAFDLLSPSSGEAVWSTAGKTKVEFRWKVDLVQSPGGALQLEASPDSEFKSGTVKAVISASHPPLKRVQVGLELLSSEKIQNWFWRVRSLSGNAVSRTEHFSVQAAPKPLAVFPGPDAQIENQESLDFVWSVPDGVLSEKYELELKTNSAEPKPNTFSSQVPRMRLGPFEAGIYVWRVRVLQKNGVHTPWSVDRTFTVIDRTLAPPPPPSELMDAEIVPKKEPKPAHTRIEKIFEWFLPTAFADDPMTYQVKVKWSAVPGATKYKIQIGRQSSFKTVIAEAETTDPQWSWPYQVGMENSKGRVFYRVASIDQRGRVGQFSGPKTITIPSSILRAPEVYGATESVPTPATLPTPAPLVSPPPQKIVKEATPVAISAATTETVPLYWQIQGAMLAGYGTTKQSSKDSGLASVSLEQPYFQQKVQAGFQVTKDKGATWQCDLQFSVAGFRASESRHPSTQPFLKAYQGELTFLRKPPSAKPWNLGWGLIIDRAFRWVKVTSLTLGTEGGVSVGPAIRLTSHDEKRGISVRAPLTGVFTGGAVGARGTLWNQWSVTQIQTVFIDFQVSGEADYLRWSTPSRTGTYHWTLWAGLIGRLPARN